MSWKINTKDQDPYSAVADILDEWCLKNYYGSFLVTLKLGKDYKTTQFVYFDASNLAWTWLNDWWEGEEEVELLGFMDIDLIQCEGESPRDD